MIGQRQERHRGKRHEHQAKAVPCTTLMTTISVTPVWSVQPVM